MLNVTLVPILSDNYAYILQSGNDIAILDPGEAQPVIDKLEELNITPSIIFNTHHHGDHVAGNAAIKEKYNCEIIGPENAKDKITFGGKEIIIFETPGHTLDHICFYFLDSKVLFSGDTMFAMGCGRAFEGTPEQLFEAFQIFKDLPDDTKIYCGHEYTQSNGDFCLSVDPDNSDLQARMKEVQALRNGGKPTIPSTIALEKKTNIFMRAKTAEEFKKYRDLKDQF